MGGVESPAIVSPRATKVIGVLPADVKPGNLTADLRQLGYAFDVLHVEATAADLANLAADLAKLAVPPP